MSETNIDAGLDYFPDEQGDTVQVQAKLDQHTTMLGGLARLGRVVQPDSDDGTAPSDVPRVLVQIGGEQAGSYIRNWMPWTTVRAGYDGEWWMPEVNEQVLVVAPSGNLSLGVIVGSLFRGALNFETDEAGITPTTLLPDLSSPVARIHRRVYKDGSSMSYDRDAHNLSVLVKETHNSDERTEANFIANKEITLIAGNTKIVLKQNGELTLSSPDGGIFIQGDVSVEGNIKVKGNLDVN